MSNIKVSLLQYQAGSNKEANLKLVSKMFAEAMAYQKPHLIALPETFNFRGKPEANREAAEPADNSASLNFLRELATEYKVSVMAGTHPVLDGSPNPFNRAHYINASGDLLASYSKVHLFDVQLETRLMQESANSSHGSSDANNLQVFTDTLNGWQVNFAMGICYDLRFPELFRHYMFNCGLSPDIIFLPSAFSYETGSAHWEALLRARAVENSVFMIAPNQIGKNENGFECYGNSMVVDPWGKVLVRGTASSPQILTVEIDLDQVREVRKRLPLQNRRLS